MLRRSNWNVKSIVHLWIPHSHPSPRNPLYSTWPLPQTCTFSDELASVACAFYPVLPRQPLLSSFELYRRAAGLESPSFFQSLAKRDFRRITMLVPTTSSQKWARWRGSGFPTASRSEPSRLKLIFNPGRGCREFATSGESSKRVALPFTWLRTHEAALSGKEVGDCCCEQ